MDHQPRPAQSELECILFDESAEPKALPLLLLEHITNSFSDDREIGYGGFARVYKGVLTNGTVAVKKLFSTVDIDEKKFIEEVSCLMKAKQKNIVRFLGYCSDTQGEMLHCEGKLVLAEVRQRLLCFEYLPKGSLDKKITDASYGLEWSERYKIITGICDGLYYLHQKRILHLDLKPANILLDDNMMPKIADFGLSRCFHEDQSRAITSKLIGTLGYLAPEFYRGQITFKLDIYSLGIIIIEMLTGEKGYPNIDDVLERWRIRLEKTQGDIQLVQVRVCTEIAIQCTDSDPEERPDTQHIVDRLGATKSVNESGAETGASSSWSVAQVRSEMTHYWGDVFYPGYYLPHFKVHASIDKCSSNIILLEPTNPIELTIDRLENVKSAKEAQSIKLTEKQKIENLTFQWTLAAGRSVDDKEVLEKLVPPSSVKKFSIVGYKSVSIPDWLMGISQYLTNLLEIDLWDFPNCNNLPPFSQLPNLQCLNLFHMDGLEEWNTAYTSGEEGPTELMFPKLKELNITHCAKLRIKPCLPRAMSISIVECDNMLSTWEENSSHSSASSSSPITKLTVGSSKLPLHRWKLLHHLPSLCSLIITDCSDLTSPPAIIKHLFSLQSLLLRLGSNHQAGLPSWLFELTLLQELEISHPKLHKLDENTRKLTRLQKLSLYECISMTSLPQWLGELTSLKKFEVKYCKGISFLPDSIQQLTNLESLKIYGCPTLKEWCESKENKMKLGHIRWKDFDW